MARPREKPITPTLRRLMALAGCGDDLAEFAKLHGISVHTVRNWDGRGGVPAARLAEFAAQYKTTVEALSASDESNEPRDSTHGGLNEVREAAPPSLHEQRSNAPAGAPVDSNRDRAVTAINIVQAGLAAEGVDPSKVPVGDMAYELMKLLPASIPRIASKKP